MEKAGKKKTVKRVAALLLTMLMLVGCLPLAFAEGSGLKPDPVHYTNGKEVTDGSTGDIVLSKTAERIGPDEWKVKVEAEIERTVGRPQPNLELVVVLDTSGSMAWCTDEFAHAAGSHTEHSVDNGCYTLICTETGLHYHSVYRNCYELNCTRPFVKHTTSGNSLCSYRQGSNWVNYTPNRLAVAKSNITSLVNSLNASNNIEKKEIKYVVFSDDANQVTNLNNVQAKGGTHMYTGIRKGLTLFNQDDSYRKILIVVTDGAANDGSLKNSTLELLDEAKEEKNIAVFTVGFSYENEDLSAIAGNGGSYVHAGNQVELEKAFQGIEETIRAMMVDPMGTTVGFDSNSFDVSTSEVKGNVSYVGNTLYWNPMGDSVPAGSKISYSYTVKLNNKADKSRGSHTGVALNAPTDFLYSITNGTTVSHYAVGFPIPQASYKISTLKERWVNKNGQAILSDSAEEKIITDYSNTTDDGVHKVYTPAFTTDYNHPVQSIPVTSSNREFYLYKYSTVTKNNATLENGVDDINPENEAAAYVVTHHYEKVDGYKVSYTYEGEVPDTAVAASSFNTMAQAGATVQVAENPSAGGYRFLGWECETSDVSVSGGAFTMPSKHVSFVGRWEKVHSYQVNANYFYVFDGDYSMPTQENTSEILLEHVNCENGNTTSYTLPADAFIYNDNTYTSVQLGSAASGVTVSDNVINGIVPGSGTVPKIVVNLYRDIKRDYELNVKHVFKDNTTHEGYPSAYPDVGPKYQYDQPWDVSNLGAPEGYALVVSESGVATSATNDTLMKGVLKEDTFGKADKYVILTYEKLPTYQVTIHFVSEEPTKARLIAEDYVSAPAYAGTTYDVKAQLPSYIEDGEVFWYYSGDESLSGDPLRDKLDSNKVITAKYYLNPTYTITATYTTVTDGVSSSEVKTSSGTHEAGVPVPFTQSDYDNKVSPFTEEHFQNDLKVNGAAATTMPDMKKFSHYEVTLSYLRQVNNPYRAVVKYQDQNGNELKAPANSAAIVFGQSYNMENAKLETIVADGVKYLFVSDDTKANNTAYSGTMPKDGVEIIRTYQPAPKYTVTYQYTNTIEGAPALPVDENTYYEGDTVTVKDAVSKDGYTFSGWSTTDATIAGREFAMPNKNVVLVGSWTEKDRYRVTIHFVSEEPTKARLIAEDYVSDPAYAGTTYDVRAQLPSYIEDGEVFWYYSGDESLSGDPLRDKLDSNKVITAKYYLNPTYTITATYTTVTDGVSSSEVKRSSGTHEVGVPVPFTQSDYDNKVTGFTEKHFQNDLKVNGIAATTMPTMEKFGHYEVTLSYLRQVNNPYRAVVKYQDQNGNELKDPARSDEITFGQHYDMETAKLETIVADGVKYLFVSDDTDANNTAYSGNMPKGGVQIIRTYQPAPKYTVTYQYSNTIEGAPALPEDKNTYYEGDTVTVKDAVSKDGYTFSGWSTTDATIAAGEFAMPNKNVVLVGSWTEKDSYRVTIHFVSEEPTKARLIAEDYVSDPAYAGTTYDVRAQLPEFIEDGKVFWYYSGNKQLSGDPLKGTLDSNKVITAKYYLNPTYTITATYTTVTDGVSSSEVKRSSGTHEVGVPVPFTQSDYDNMVSPFTEKHFQNDLKVNGVDATTMPTMEKFGHYEVTLSYLRQVNNPYRAVVKYQDQNGNELKDPANSEEITFGQPYDMKTAKLETIVADGVKYLFVSDDTKENKTAYSGKMPKGGVEIIRTYQPAPKYTVTYQYSNTIEGAPTLPMDENTYYEGDTVTVKNAVSKDGYTFSGWSITDATIAAGEFAMPGKNVVLVGSWTKKNRYRVTIHFVSEDTDKATLAAADYISDPAYAGTTYDVTAQLPSYIEDGKVFWYYSGNKQLSGDPLKGTLDSNKDITAEYYLKPTYTITATYTTVTDGVSSNEVVTSSGKDEVDVPVPFTQSDYDNKVTGFTEEHFQNDLKVNGIAATTMPTMEKFGHYEVTLSYLRQVNNPYRAVVKYQDQNGNELKDPDRSDEITFGKHYDMEGAKLETIEADGVKYLFVSDDTKENKTAYSGNMPKGGVEIIRTYQPAPKYTVTYQYSNTIEGAPALPVDENTYYERDTVAVKDAVSKEGYTFSGWSTTDATIADGKLPMPGKNVVLVGSWTKKPSYQVIVHYYTITDGVKASTPDQTVDTGIQYCDTTSPVTVPYETTVSSVEYSSPKLAENTAGATLDETNRQVINITPATETAKVVVELTRTVTSSAEYKVVHQYYTVDPDLVETKTEQDVTETFTGSHQQTINAADVADHVIGKYERVSDSGSIVLDKDEPRTITITYKRYQYRVTIDGDEGVEIISGKTAAEGGTIHDRGEDVAVSFQIKDGYLLTGMKVDEHELRNGSNVVSFPAISENHQVVLTTSLRQKGVATVHFVDEEGNLLKDSLISEELYIGDEFDVSQALEVEKITLGNSEYAFDRHFQKRNMVRSTNGLMTVEDVDYIGQMPAGGVEIIRVYKLDKVACYYQVKKVFTGYDAEGAVVYSAMEESAVTETGNLSETITLPETSNHGEYGFRLVSDAVMTGDLTGSTKEAPYVFVAYYEVRQDDEPVPGTQLPPGLTPPSKPDSSSGSATGAESLPPSTGDAGVAHWAVLMVLAAAGLLMMFAKRKA